MNTLNKNAALVAIGMGLAALAGPVTAAADDVADFYKDRTVTYVAPTGTAGSYALIATVIQRHIAKHIPGNPTVIIDHKPGAGGTVAANYLYNAAPKDGTVFGGVLSGLAHTQVFRPEAVKYDAAKFNWLGAWGEAYQVTTVFHTANVSSIREAMTREVIVASTGKASLTYQLPTLLNATIGTKFKPVTGYRGGGDSRAAMERGEVDGFTGFYSSWETSKPEWVAKDMITHIVQHTVRKHPEMQEVPRTIDLAENEEQTKMFRFMSATGRLARGVAAPPGIPEDRVAALRKAFADMLRDEEYLAETKRLKIATKPVTGEEVMSDIQEILGADAETVQKVKAAIGFN